MGKSLIIRKLADIQPGQVRLTVYDQFTGERRMVNPETPGQQHEPWPLAGIKIEGAPPAETSPSTAFVANGRAEGWIEVEGEEVEHAPGGPPENPWATTHTFVKLSALTLKTIDGDVSYRVVGNPGKYDDENDPSGKRIDWFYTLKLVE